MLKLWKAVGGPLGLLLFAVLAFEVWIMQVWLREVQCVDAHPRKACEAHEARADRERAAHEERPDRGSERSMREHARLADAVAALKGDVKVQLDRSERSSDVKASSVQPSTVHEVARQATPVRCEDDAKTSSSEKGTRSMAELRARRTKGLLRQYRGDTPCSRRNL